MSQLVIVISLLLFLFFFGAVFVFQTRHMPDSLLFALWSCGANQEVHKHGVYRVRIMLMHGEVGGNKQTLYNLGLFRTLI